MDKEAKAPIPDTLPPIIGQNADIGEQIRGGVHEGGTYLDGGKELPVSDPRQSDQQPTFIKGTAEPTVKK